MTWSEKRLEAYENMRAAKAKGEPLKREDMLCFTDLELLANDLVGEDEQHLLPERGSA